MEGGGRRIFCRGCAGVVGGGKEWQVAPLPARAALLSRFTSSMRLAPRHSPPCARPPPPSPRARRLLAAPPLPGEEPVQDVWQRARALRHHRAAVRRGEEPGGGVGGGAHQEGLPVPVHQRRERGPVEVPVRDVDQRAGVVRGGTGRYGRRYMHAVHTFGTAGRACCGRLRVVPAAHPRGPAPLPTPNGPLGKLCRAAPMYTCMPPLCLLHPYRRRTRCAASPARHGSGLRGPPASASPHTQWWRSRGGAGGGPGCRAAAQRPPPSQLAPASAGAGRLAAACLSPACLRHIRLAGPLCPACPACPRGPPRLPLTARLPPSFFLSSRAAPRASAS